jgi:hypothetical protein
MVLLSFLCVEFNSLAITTGLLEKCRSAFFMHSVFFIYKDPAVVFIIFCICINSQPQTHLRNTQTSGGEASRPTSLLHFEGVMQSHYQAAMAPTKKKKMHLLQQAAVDPLENALRAAAQQQSQK